MVDTVPFGCYRRDIFDRVGLYNEHLVRNQDIELNLRLKNAGGKIILVPDIVSYYHARTTLTALAKNNFWNGYWVVYSMKFAKLPFSFRHLIPFAFVLSLLGSLGLALLLPFDFSECCRQLCN
jgi:GT2 family glycosyltransferase